MEPLIWASASLHAFRTASAPQHLIAWALRLAIEAQSFLSRKRRTPPAGYLQVLAPHWKKWDRRSLTTSILMLSLKKRYIGDLQLRLSRADARLVQISIMGGETHQVLPWDPRS